MPPGTCTFHFMWFFGLFLGGGGVWASPKI
jgi:hypothetical protein